MESKNLNYVFNVEYFDLLIEKQNPNEINIEFIKLANERKNIVLDESKEYLKQIKEISNYNSFELFTTNPGAIIGIGYPHDITTSFVPTKGAIQVGFLFDYVTGAPYYPGSSLKGIIRSIFNKALDKNNSEEDKTNYFNYINEISNGKLNKDNLKKFMIEVFGDERIGSDVFLDCHITCCDGDLFGLDNITPHNEEIKNPIPLTILKLMPNVGFTFSFIIKDSVYMKADEKLEMYKKIILDLGFGAKTNVGYGNLVENKIYNDKKIQLEKYKIIEKEQKKQNSQNGKKSYDNKSQSSKKPHGICQEPGCNNSCTKKTNGEFNKYCYECYIKNKGKK